MTAHPCYAPLSRWLDTAPAALTLDHLNRLARADDAAPVTDAGAPIHFVAAAGTMSAVDYETRILQTGAVPTRPGNLHDAFNALCWIAFPQFKRACNALHAAHAAAAQGARDAGGAGVSRGPARDALTLLDESGVIVLCADPSLAELLRERRWRALFADRRADVGRALRFLVCGHALYEKLQRPYAGLTGRALLVTAPERLFAGTSDAQRQHADRGAAALLRADIHHLPMAPLPLAGIPGWDPANAAAAFYDNAAVFRPAAASIAAGSESTSAHSASAPAAVSSAGVPKP